MIQRLHKAAAFCAATGAVAIALAAGNARAATLNPDADYPMRIVMDHWPENGWVVRQYETHVEIKFPGAEIEIAVPPTLLDNLEGYLSDISVDAQEGATFVRLTLACACVPAVSGDGQSRLTVDIVGPPQTAAELQSPQSTASLGPAPRVAPTPLPKKGANADQATVSAGDIDVEEARNRLITQLLRAAEAGLVEMQPGDDAPTPTSPETTAESESQSAGEGASPAELVENAPAVAATDEDLLERVSEAATAGDDILASLAEQQLPASGADESAKAPGSVDAGPLTSSSTNAEQAATTSQSGKSDPESEAPKNSDVASPAEQQIASIEPTCFENDMFDFSNVPEHHEMMDAIMFHRGQMVGEFDRSTPEHVIELAKLYIFNGFTVEARQIIETFAPDDQRAPLYYELSRLLDGDLLDSSASLLHSDCVGEQALWRGFAEATAGQGADAVQSEGLAGRALERLPLELREKIAAWIGDAAATVGDWDSARRMQAIANRAATSLPGKSGRSHLLSAKLAFWNGEHDAGVAHLQSASVMDPRTASEALFALGEMALDDPKLRGASTKNLQADLGAMARILGETKDGQRAFEMEVKLANRAQSQEMSMDLVSHGVAAGLVDESRQYELMTEVITDPDAEADAQPLAMTYLDDPERFQPALELAGFRKELARSMIEMSVPRLAAEVLRAEDFSDAELSLKLANALVSSGADRAAMEVIAKLPDGPEKSRLLGDSFLSRGQPDKAMAHFDRAIPEIKDQDETLAVLEIKAKAARDAGDMAAALSANEEIFKRAPTIERAQQIAFLALAEGWESLPDAVSSHLAESAPDVLAGLEPLFGNSDSGPDLESATAVETYLQELDAEEKAIQELLNNG